MQRPALSLGARRAEQAGRSNLCGLHGEEAMTQGISSDVLIPAKRTERTERANITRYAHLGESIGAMKLSGSFGDAQTAIAPSSVAIDMKNTINIDKYMKRFMAINTMVIYYNSCKCRVILK